MLPAFPRSSFNTAEFVLSSRTGSAPKWARPQPTAPARWGGSAGAPARRRPGAPWPGPASKPGWLRTPGSVVGVRDSGAASGGAWEMCWDPWSQLKGEAQRRWAELQPVPSPVPGYLWCHRASGFAFLLFHVLWSRDQIIGFCFNVQMLLTQF